MHWIGREGVEGVHGGELGWVDTAGTGNVRGKGREEDAKARTEGVGGGEVRLGFRGRVIRVEDVGSVQNGRQGNGLLKGEGVG